MNVEQALNAADEAEEAGLCGLYPMAAQVLAAELRRVQEMNISKGMEHYPEYLLNTHYG